VFFALRNCLSDYFFGRQTGTGLVDKRLKFLNSEETFNEQTNFVGDLRFNAAWFGARRICLQSEHGHKPNGNVLLL